MASRLLLVVLALLLVETPAAAQALRPATQGAGLLNVQPRPYEILGLSVEGVENEAMQAFVIRSSNLKVGQEVVIPGGDGLAEAIRALYRTGAFSDVKILQDRQTPEGVFLTIRVREEPRLANYRFEGIKKKHRDDIRNQVPLLRGARVDRGDLERTKQVIRNFYEEKGHLQTRVEVDSTVLANNTLELTFNVDRGRKIEVSDIRIQGNEAFSDRRIRKQMDTKENRWWRFWKGETFKPDAFEEDLESVVRAYNEKGYYDARIERDSVYLENEEGEPELVVELTVHEGPQYHVRNVEWDGNTVYPDPVLTNALRFEQGDVFNTQQLEENLYGNRRSSDIASLYMNRGYMRFNAQPTVRVVEGDSVDLLFDVFEGDVYAFGDIAIEGNTRTKDHVIRRELYTVPGQTFSRDDIQETIRRLSQLNYFSQESLAEGPGIQIDEEDQEVDLTYSVEEVGSDQLELSGTYGRFGVVLMLRFTFNNFSIQDVFEREAWRPLPQGDGQKLSVGVQTNGTFFQSYSLSFTEPWFRGRPTPIGFSVSHSRYSGRTNFFFGTDTSDDDSRFIQTTATFFHERRLKWPDDRFSYSAGLRYQFFNNEDFTRSLPDGISQEVSVQQSLSRNSLDNPLFPTRGSLVRLALDVAPPVGGFVQYHKWRFESNWNVPILPKLTLNVGTDYGYIGSLTGDEVQFERFIVGGSPFDAQGFRDTFGKDIIYMRGYPSGVIGPRIGGNDEPAGGRILNRYTSELRWLAVQSPQLQAAPYLFLDAANTWDRFATYSPSELFRSAGVGVRMFLPILGMIELVYGRNLDSFAPVDNDHDGTRQWLFQFTLGRGFNQ